MFYIIDLPYACFGIETKDEIITKTPPIAKWMKGHTIAFVKAWVEKKRGNIYTSENKI